MEYTLPVQIPFKQTNWRTEPERRVFLFARLEFRNGENHSFLFPLDGKKDPLSRLRYKNKEEKSMTDVNPPTGGVSFLSMEGIVDLKGASKTYLCATTTATHDDLGITHTFEDIPVEVDYDGARGFLQDLGNWFGDVGEWIDENKDFLINAVVATVVIVAGVALIVATGGAAAALLPAYASAISVLSTGTAIAFATAGYATYARATIQDVQTGEARSPQEMFKNVKNGALAGASYMYNNLTFMLFPEIAAIPGATTAVSMLNGTNLRTLRVEWDKTLTAEQKLNYAYNPKLVALDGAFSIAAGQITKLFAPKSLIPSAAPAGNYPPIMLPSNGGSNLIPSGQIPSGLIPGGPVPGGLVPPITGLFPSPPSSIALPRPTPQLPAPSGATTRPSWQDSEAAAGDNHPEYESQKSFKDGVETTYGAKGSTRPELYKPGHSIEVKNYNVMTGSGQNNLINNVSRQVNSRTLNLPKGTKQTIIIDVRGQKVTNDALKSIKNRILAKTKTEVEILFYT